MEIDIVSNNKCVLRFDVPGEQSLQLTGVSGAYQYMYFTKDDYITFEYVKKDEEEGEKPVVPDDKFDEEEEEKPKIMLMSDGTGGEVPTDKPKPPVTEKSQVITVKMFQDVFNPVPFDDLQSMVSTMSDKKLKAVYDQDANQFNFTQKVLDMSPAFRYAFGVRKFPTTKSDVVPSTSGSPLLFIKCDKLVNHRRYCWQTDPNKISNYASICNIISLSLNTFQFGYPFQLPGVAFQLNSFDGEAEFTITGLYGEEIKLLSDVLWNFVIANKE